MLSAACFDALLLCLVGQAHSFGATITTAEQLAKTSIKKNLASAFASINHVLFEERIADVTMNIRLSESALYTTLQILMLRMLCVFLFERRGWYFVDKADKAAMEHIAEILQPPSLITRIKNKLKIRRITRRATFSIFSLFWLSRLRFVNVSNYFGTFKTAKITMLTLSKPRDRGPETVTFMAFSALSKMKISVSGKRQACLNISKRTVTTITFLSVALTQKV